MLGPFTKLPLRTILVSTALLRVVVVSLSNPLAAQVHTQTLSPERGGIGYLRAGLLLCAVALVCILVCARAYRRVKREIARLTRTEADLRKRSDILESVLNTIGDGVIVVDEHQNGILFNPAAERILGGPPSAAPVLCPDKHGLYLSEQGNKVPLDQLPLAGALRGEPVEKLDLFVQNPKSPQGIWLRMSCRPLTPANRKPGRTPGGVIVLTEITDLKRAEKALFDTNKELELRNRDVERANQLKSAFLASMSHELRTPLNAIIGFADLMAEAHTGDLNEKQRRFIERIRTASRHLLALINDILDLSRIEAGCFELRREEFQAADAADEVLSVVKPLAAAKNIALVGDLSRDLWVNADRIRFKQVLYNLLSNAIKFTGEGGAVCMESRMDGTAPCISVVDTGVGIKAEDQQVIFQAFRQVGTTTRGLAEGTGLGLAIAKKIVDYHGGRIWVDSEPGKGSRFSFTIAAQSVRYGAAIDTLVPIRSEAGRARPILQDVPLAFSLAVPARTASRDRKALVLIADDDMASRELMLTYLEPTGCETATAGTGAEAIEKALTLRADVIVLDVLLAEKSGWKALEELKSQPATSQIPVIVVTVSDDKQAGYALGADEYLVKPVVKADFLSSILRHLPLRPFDAPATLVNGNDAEPVGAPERS